MLTAVPYSCIADALAAGCDLPPTLASPPTLRVVTLTATTRRSRAPLALIVPRVHRASFARVRAPRSIPGVASRRINQMK